MRARRSSSTVPKRRTHSRFSFSVRMNRSAQPLPSGSRTKAGELSRPRKRTSARKSWLTYRLPWSWRSRRPAATPLANAPKRSRTACLTGSSASKRSARWMAGVDADALGRAMINGDEYRRLALAGHDRGQVAAPHHIDPLGGDPAVMGSRAMRAAGTLMGQEAVLAHQPQDAAPAGAEAGEAQPRPQLAVALAMERAARQKLADRRHQIVIRPGPRWSRPLALSHSGWAAVAIEGRPRHAPDPRHPLQAIDAIRGGRDLPAHRLDLRRAKGRGVSRRSIFTSRSSLVIVSSPTLACSRPISASRASPGRLFSGASPPARDCA